MPLSHVQHWFVVGIADANAHELKFLKEEQATYGDMLFLPIGDSVCQTYSGCARTFSQRIFTRPTSCASVIFQYRGGAMMKKYFIWLHYVLVDLNLKPKYFLRVTHDNYINIPLILQETRSAPKERLYWGYNFIHNQVWCIHGPRACFVYFALSLSPFLYSFCFDFNTTFDFFAGVAYQGPQEFGFQL